MTEENVETVGRVCAAAVLVMLTLGLARGLVLITFGI